MRSMFEKMEFVMSSENWDWPTLMRCIYGLAKPDELSEAWIEKWLDRQIEIIDKNAKTSLTDEMNFIAKWWECETFNQMLGKCLHLNGYGIMERIKSLRLRGISLKILKGEDKYAG